MAKVTFVDHNRYYYDIKILIYILEKYRKHFILFIKFINFIANKYCN